MGSAVSELPGATSPAVVEQARRGRSSINSGVGERIADLFIGGALVASGVVRRGIGGATLIAGGGWFLYAAATGHFSPYATLSLVREGRRSSAPLIVERSITVNLPREQAYAYWRDLARLPTFMRNLESVTVTDQTRSHWVVTAPLGKRVEWDAEVTDDQPNARIAWRSLPGTNVPNQGEVRFADAPGQRGAEIWVRLTYQPPLGTAGAVVARLYRREPNQQIDVDLRRLKAILEAGEAPTVERQPHGKHVWSNAGKGRGSKEAIA
jgi:uncharacterized membrane protein